MRILHSSEFRYPIALEIFLKNANWLQKSFQNSLVMNQEAKDLLEKGIAYIFGRDHALRPIVVLGLRKLKQLIIKDNVSTSTLRNFLRRLVSYLDEKLFVPGSVE